MTPIKAADGDRARDLAGVVLCVGVFAEFGGCAAKGWRVLRSRSIAPAMEPAGLLPLRLRRPLMIAMCATEFALGLGLIATAGKIGTASPGLAATVARAGTALFFLIAVGALNETR